MKISVCIPTYRRPEFLKEAIDSCLKQTMLPYDIVIGDDSKDDRTKIMMDSFQTDKDVIISYNHHVPSLKQADNTNFLFNHAKGDKVLLLHDDDLLLPEAIETMVKVFEKDPSVNIVFGKQYLMSETGEIDYENSPQLNEFYFRTEKYEGSKLSAIEAGIIQQFPNDCYMMDVDLATRIPWRKESSIGFLGNGNEMDWSIRIGLAEPKMYFVNKYLALYRVTEVSNSASSDSAFKAYLMLENLKVAPQYEPMLQLALKRKSELGVRQAIKLNHHKDALRIFFSKHHTPHMGTLGYYKSLLLLVLNVLKSPFKN